MGPSQLRRLKLKPTDLNSCVNKIAVAGGTSLNATGWIEIEAKLGSYFTRAKVYYSKRVGCFFLSRQCCRVLRTISDSFLYPPTNENAYSVATAEEPTR